MTGLELRLGRVPCGRVAEAPVLLPAGRTRSLVIGAAFALNAEGSVTADLCVCVCVWACSYCMCIRVFVCMNVFVRICVLCAFEHSVNYQYFRFTQ